jgi:hypothetical protein
MTIGKLWKVDKEGGPVAKGYLTIFNADIPIVVWRNKSDNPNAPKLTIALDTGAPVRTHVGVPGKEGAVVKEQPTQQWEQKGAWKVPPTEAPKAQQKPVAQPTKPVAPTQPKFEDDEIPF